MTVIKRSWFNDKGIDSSSRNPKKSKKPTMAQLQQELTELQSKYAQLCTKLETLSEWTQCWTKSMSGFIDLTT